MRLVIRALLALTLVTYVATAYAAVTVSVNGVNHTIPQTNEKGWGNNVTAWIQAISANTLQPSGGTFTLTADANFGGSYGLVSAYFKSRSSNISSSGALRLANTDTIGWRNNANSGNVLLSVDSSDRLLFNGVLLPQLSSSDFTDSGFTISDNGDATKKIAFQASGITTATTRTLTVPDASGTLVLEGATQTLTGKTLDADDNTLSDIANASIKANAGIVYSKLSIASGDIALAKLAALTADRAVVSDGSGVLSASATTATQIGYLSTLSSNAQTQLDAKVAKSAYTAKGDVLIGSTASTPTVLSYSGASNGDVLTKDTAEATGVKWATPATAPDSSDEISNCSLSTSVGSSALTIALKNKSGSDPSAGSPCKIGFRDTTASTGTYSQVLATAATSLVISSGSTLGTISATATYLSVYAINNGGTIELAVINGFLDEGSLATSTAEGGAGAADSAQVLYSTTARTSKAIRLIGRILITEATAGTWASNATEVSLQPFTRVGPRSEVIVDTGNGYGSSATKVRRFTNTRKNIGSAITYADSSTNGGTFTINEPGIYAMDYTDYGTATFFLAITVNTSATTTSASSLAYSDGRRFGVNAAANISGQASWTGYLNAGDVVRAMTNAAAGSSTDNFCMFSIVKVSP